MSKLAAILFSTLILVQSSNISFDDLSKLNVLLEHAEYHKATYGDSFIDFLAQHYDESVFENGFDHKEHKNLPFKHQYLDSYVQVIFELINLNLDVNIHEIDFNNKNFTYNKLFSNQYVNNFFQPPQK